MSKHKFWESSAAFTILSILWAWYAGKDLNWDFMNYHFYGPYMLLNNRLGSDYFAGSLQGYLNPTGYLPLYAMINCNWHPFAIGATLAVIHSFNFSLLWAISNKILPSGLKHRSAACFVAVALAFIAPLQLTMLGGTFLDPITSIFVLAGIYLLVERPNGVTAATAASVGLAAGIAAGLKLTNLLVLPAFVIAMAVANGNLSIAKSIGRLGAFGAGSLTGALITHGYWSFMLAREMGSPLFPLLNNIFQSPDFPQFAFQDQRYLHDGFWGIFTLPFSMLSHRGWVYSENIVADPRPLAFCIAAIFAGLSIAKKTPQQSVAAKPIDDSKLAFRTILVFAATFYLLWATGTRIGRYAIVLWLLIGPMIVAMLVRIKWRIISLTVGGLAVAIQILFLFNTGNMRWTPAVWGDQWMDIRVPDKLRVEPAAYLTMGTLSFSAMIPSFNPASRFSNIVGQYMQPVGEKMTKRMQEFLATDLPLKVIFVVNNDNIEELTEEMKTDVSATLSAYGLQLKNEKCEIVEVVTDRLVDYNHFSHPKTTKTYRNFAVCTLSPIASSIKEEALIAMKRVDKMFDKIEQSCGPLLSPHGVQTIRGIRGWMRTYFNTNTQLLFDGTSLAIRPSNAMNDLLLGTPEQWSGTNGLPDCPSLEAPM